jgi:hypothetical protein
LVVATGVYPFIFLINKMHRKSNFWNNVIDDEEKNYDHRVYQL